MNKNIEKSRLYAWRSMIFCGIFSLILGSCTTNSSVAPSARESYTGEELFRGLFFLQGEVPTKIDSYKAGLEQIADIKQKSGRAWESYDSFSNDIIEGIKRFDPNYFDSFKSKIESDNMYEIEKALNDGIIIMRKVGLQSKKYKNLFNIVGAVEDDILNNKLNVDNIDVNTEEGKKQLQQIVNQKYSLNNDPNARLDKVNSADGACLVAIVAVAVAVLEVAGVVNVVTLINLHNTVFVHMIVKAKVAAYAFPQLRVSATSQEKLIEEISVNL